MTQQPTVPHPKARGVVLLITLLLVVLVVAIGAGMLKLTTANQQQNSQNIRQDQSKKAAKTAVSIAMAQMKNKLLPVHDDPGDLTGGVTISNVGSESIEHIEQRLDSPTDSAYTGDAALDQFDNDNDGIVDNEASNTYRGTKFRITIKEWDTSMKIGAPGIDDDHDGIVDEHPTTTGSNGKDDHGMDGKDNDGDGLIDESDEGNGKVDEPAEKETEVPRTSTYLVRRFTVVVSATRNNYTTNMHAFVKAEITSEGNYAMYAKDNLTIKSKSYFDSYESEEGSYSSQTPGTNGSIATEQYLTVNSDSEILGDAKWGTGKDIDSTAYIDGDKEPLVHEQKHPPSTIERDVLSSFSGGNLKVDKNDTYTIPKSENYKKISQGSGSTLNVQAGDELVIGGGNWSTTGNGQQINIGKQATVVFQDSLTIGSGSTITVQGPDDLTKEPTKILINNDLLAKQGATLETNGRVEVHAIEEMRFKAKSEINTLDQKPYNLTFRVGGTWTETDGTIYNQADGNLILKAKGDFRGNLYGPNATMAVKNSGTFFGKTVGDTIDLKKDLDFHYDYSICKTACSRKNVSLAGCQCQYNNDKVTSWITSQKAGPSQGF